ncbi:EAL domain-containing protein [Massilia sp. ST3]|uniref:EAL domain-containing protein n=1 Tax=Massilia sp. ST3 TaxID=2824903 RepID=UPI001B827368|nr:EAL domain-containing protein [Massilia sp. ST3]MBQ5946016.1 EAL domain-containing protein [Massilia sp. ST3]
MNKNNDYRSDYRPDYNPAPARPVEILIVEDSVTQAEQLAHLLAREGGYQVRVAANGLEGLAAARQRAPTLIVSDISMPEMDGFAMCREVKQDPRLRDIPVILLTSLTSLYDVIRGLDSGADNFIRKPFDSRYLLGRIRFILANRALRSNERVQLGMQVNLGGQTHFITAERQQIFDLLISTYEEAIQMTEELKQQKQRIARSYQSLEGLYKIAESLNPALTERAVADSALERVLDFPGVAGGCLALLDNGRLRVAAVSEADGPIAPGALLECGCARMLMTDELRQPELRHECEALGGMHACVPLSAGGRHLGLLHLATTPEALSADDMQVLGTVGNQIAIAIERAHLYANMEALVHERTEALQSERNLLSTVMATTGALVVLCAPDGRIALFNRSCEETFGWTAAEALGRPVWDVFTLRDDESAVRRFWHDLPLDEMPRQIQGEWLARDGAVRSVIWSTAPIRNGAGEIEGVLSTGMDVTELRGVEDRLRYLSNYDSLTGLPNRALLRDRVLQLQEPTRADGQAMGFLVIGLERLSLVRQTLGDRAERALLADAARRLSSLSAGDTVARYAEGTFALAARRGAVDELGVLARQVLECLGRPFAWEGEELHLDPRIGIAVFPNDGDSYESLAQGAESALARVDAGGERYTFFRPEFNEGAEARFRLENALRRAIEREEFLLHYQPQVDLKSGAIVGVEALVRWRHPERGMVSPAVFIDLAEETGLILPLGEWVLRRACQQCRAWQDAGLEVVPVSVNLSARQFSEQIPATVRRILDETGLEPRLLELELTESASMKDPQKTFAILRQLKDMGVRLAIDDFGTGYSNLNYLKRFPVDKLKLDQSFVCDIVSDPDDLSISRAVIAMGHGLRLTVIAEGVESQGQLSLLADNGCDEMQGYLFSRPVPAEECEVLMREGASLQLGQLQRAPYARTVLVVDDDASLQAAVRRALRHRDTIMLSAANAAEAFEILATTEVGVIMCDQRLAVDDGAAFLPRVRQLHPAVTRVVLSGAADLQSVTDAVNHGAIFKYLIKPWDDEELDLALEDGFAEYERKRLARIGQ